MLLMELSYADSIQDFCPLQQGYKLEERALIRCFRELNLSDW